MGQNIFNNCLALWTMLPESVLSLLQTVIEATRLAPRWNSQLAEVHERELAKGNRNRATLAVARKLVAYMFAVDKNQRKFTPKESMVKTA